MAKRKAAPAVDLVLPMDCVCGLPVSEHYTAERRRLTCDHLQFIKELRVGQIVQYWRAYAKGHRPVLVTATIKNLSADHDFARVDLHNPTGPIVSVSSVETHRFLWKKG